MSNGEGGTLIVTGVSRGIGAAIAVLGGSQGHAVIVNYLTAENRA